MVEIMTQQNGGELPAAPLRSFGQNFAELGADLLARAGERDAMVVEGEVLDPPALR